MNELIEKECIVCHEVKLLEKFNKHKIKNGFKHAKKCIKCNNDRYRMQYYYNTRGDIALVERENTLNRERYKKKHPNVHAHKHILKTSEEVILNNAKRRAINNKIEFNLTIEDIIIPEFCPVLKIKLCKNTGCAKASSPSLDRIENSKGYVKGNVQVISWRANKIKGDSTLEELEKIVKYIKERTILDF